MSEHTTEEQEIPIIQILCPICHAEIDLKTTVGVKIKIEVVGIRDDDFVEYIS